MGIKCPKCHSDNPDTKRFCGECGTQLHREGPIGTSGPTDEIPVSATKTLETSKEELTTGSTFAGRYQIIEELGKGGMGKVYKVHDTEIKEKVALKLLKPEIASDERTIERFRNEIRLARKIAHKNVGRMFDLGKEKGIYYITMEYVEGQDLRGLIRQSRKLTVGTAISIAKQVCEGLTEAHRLGVIHRDLKPSNIMIDKEGNARIMDFGIARSLKAKGITGAGVMIGTPEYMSPEQVESKEADQRSDIYSLGVILYEMVTGRVPFEGETPLSIAVKHKTEAPQNPRELNTQIPGDLSRVILKCLEKDKANRYQSADELHSELTKIEKGIPTTEREIPKRKPITSREITVKFSLKKLLIPALVVIALVIAVVIILQFLPQKEEVIAQKIENSIAVISFENRTGDKSYDYLQKAIPNLLITSLEQTGDLYVVTWERMRDILGQIGKKNVETIDKDMGFRLCRREGVEAIVLGSFIKAENIFATDVKVLDVETKRLLKSASSRGEGVDSILVTQIDELSREIFQGIGIARQREKAAQLQIADVTTTSMETYKNFLIGKEYYEKGYIEEAHQYLKKAIEFDSTFAVAYLYLGYVYASMGNTRIRNTYYSKAKQHSTKATEKERLYIMAAYTRNVEGSPDKQFNILEQIARKYPKEKRVLSYLGNYYDDKHLYDKAIEEFNKSLKLDPNDGYALNGLAYTYINLKDYENAIKYINKYASLFPLDANPYDSIGDVYFKMGRLDQALENYKKALGIKADFIWVYWGIAYVYALKEDWNDAIKWLNKLISQYPEFSPGMGAEWCSGCFYYMMGNIDKAISVINIARERAKANENQTFLGGIDLTKAIFYLEIGDLEKCERLVQNWTDYDWNFNNRSEAYNAAYFIFLSGLLDIKKGRITSAKARLAEIRTIIHDLPPSIRENISYLSDLYHGYILLEAGAIDEAIAISKKAVPTEIIDIGPAHIGYYGFPFMYASIKDVLARAYVKKGELDKAIAEYERLITFDPNSEDRRNIHPKYHYRLAKLYEEKGWKGKAIEQYEKFLEIWKDADEDLLELIDAKARYAKLIGEK